jgi:acyl-CoA synthetase (NDP forming)
VRRFKSFGEGFPPKNIAIVGVSRNDQTNHPGYTGLGLLRMLKEAGFRGGLYAVNPYATNIAGFQVYNSLTSIPEPIDLVIVTVPAPAVPQVIEDCVKIGAHNVQICTSGFRETGEEGRELENRIREIASKTGLRIIGPNCMGFHIPSANMRMHPDSPLVPGPVAFVSQSGGHARIFLLRGPELGFGFSKAISYGNALVLDATDFLEYLATDTETGIICMYLEGIKDGRRFMKLVRQINPQKPVLIWKGGLTESGARAAASHTGSLGGARQVWDAFFKQTGAIRVSSIEEMAEVTMLLLMLKPCRGKKVAVFAAGGGSSVATGDICSEEGIELPALSPSTREGLLQFISLVNQGLANPIDVPGVVVDFQSLRRAYEIVNADPAIDYIMFHLGAEFFMGPTRKAIEELHNHISVEPSLQPRAKPIIVALSDEGHVKDTESFAQPLRKQGIPAFNSLRQACRAISRFANYHEFVAASAQFETR